MPDAESNNNGGDSIWTRLHPPEPEGWEDLPLGMRWPASQLSSANMRQLTRISNQMRRPITKLLRDAVELFCEKMLPEKSLTQSGIATDLIEETATGVLPDLKQTIQREPKLP